MHRLFLPLFTRKKGKNMWMLFSTRQLVLPAASTGQRWFRKLVRKEARQKSPAPCSLLRALVQGLLKVYRLKIEPVTIEDGQWAAEQWRPGALLSLADRLCLALSHRIRVPAVTADRAWGRSDLIIQIR